MVQYAMIIDLNKCVGCHSCSVSCKAEWDVPDQFNRSWLKRLGPEKTPYGISHTFYPGHCNHCQRPVCVTVCPAPVVSHTFSNPANGATKTMLLAATWKDPFNATIQIDSKRCLGCNACVEACPYSARYMKEKKNGRKTADKCTFCVERLEHGLKPVCVQTCLGHARVFGDINDSTSEVSQYLRKGAIQLSSQEVNLGPNVYYVGSRKDLYLLTTTCTPKEKVQSSTRRALLRAGINKAKKILL